MSKKPFKKKDEIFITLHNHLIKKWHQDFQNKNIKLGYIEKWNNLQKSNIIMHYQSRKSEFRCEKMLLFHLLDILFFR